MAAARPLVAVVGEASRRFDVRFVGREREQRALLAASQPEHSAVLDDLERRGECVHQVGIARRVLDPEHLGARESTAPCHEDRLVEDLVLGLEVEQRPRRDRDDEFSGECV